MKKILVLGSSGMLGHVAVLRLEELGYLVFGISKSRKFGNTSALLDISLKSDFARFLDEHHFDVIVNCVALLVSQSEERKDLAVYLNSYIPHYLEMKYINTSTKIIHVSTDGIFSGMEPPYCEGSPHNSQHFYGCSKYLGEITNNKDITVRSAFWGPDLNKTSTSFLNWALNQNGTINGFTNHIFNGVSSLEFVNFLDFAIRNDLAGVFHLTAQKPISKYEFMLLAKDYFKLNSDIIPVETQNVNRTLINSRVDVHYTEVDYATMLDACLKWVREWRGLYPHYEAI